MQERFLFRLSISNYKNNFILKGALLFIAHNISRSRPTRDIDFLGTSLTNGKDEIKDIIKEILKINSEDGLRFDADTIESENIVEDADYHGVRIKFYAYLESSKERIQIDIGFGDKISPKPIKIYFPTLLDFPPPQLNVYSIESALAEKFEAIVSLLLETSRMKDFYDILFFAGNHNFQMKILREAILTTFNHRGTDIELRKNIFRDKFKTDDKLQKYWNAFLQRNKLNAENNFSKVIDHISLFVEPLFDEETDKSWNNKDWKWV